MTLKEQIPPRVVGLLGFGSIAVMIVGLTLGYVLAILGLSLAAGHGIPADDLTTFESMVISIIGAICLVVGYLGWKAFLRFSF